MTRTVAFVNKKGGVGKSSCVHHLGGTLARRGLRVLMIDVDPQASLSQGLLGPRVALELPPGETLAALYEESGGDPLTTLARPLSHPNLFFVPGHDRMTHFNVPDPWTTGEDQYILRDGILGLGGTFDLVLLDCPPNIQACAWAALVAADGVVVPAQCEDYGAQGISAIQESIELARTLANPRLVLIGFLPTMLQKSLSIHATYEADLRSIYGADVFGSVVPLAKDFKEAVTLRKSIAEYKPRSAAAKSMEAVADELLARLDARVGHGIGPDGSAMEAA